uniref:Uncharacterized protein n=1 Tax=Acanthochromis polyacanthus TaxID=80966 RepID=A0A3Q1G9L6_9TELE
MASLYQRFTGKINTNKSFPNPPEASHLLGQNVEGDRPVDNQRPRLQRPYRRHSEDEDVRNPLYLSHYIIDFGRRTLCPFKSSASLVVLSVYLHLRCWMLASVLETLILWREGAQVQEVKHRLRCA